MSAALNPDLPIGMLSNLIVADIAPSKGDLSSEFRGYIEGMKKIDASKVSTRKEAQEILLQYEKVCPQIDTRLPMPPRIPERCLIWHPLNDTGPYNPRVPINKYFPTDLFNSARTLPYSNVYLRRRHFGAGRIPIQARWGNVGRADIVH